MKWLINAKDTCEKLAAGSWPLLKSLLETFANFVDLVVTRHVSTCPMITSAPQVK
jgi:hypothetical protein